MKEVAFKAVCQMCGARDGDFWETRPARRVVLSARPRAGGIFQTWTICDECHKGLVGLRFSAGNLRAVCTNCNEGLQNAAPQKPDRIQLLAQIRRATIDDQQAVLDWLQKKFVSKI
jgi:hypothetical protein